MKNNKGFTLIEMVIVMSLFGIILLMFSGVWQNIMHYWDNLIARIELQQNLRLGMGAILNDLKESQSIIIEKEATLIIKNLNNKSIKYEILADPQAGEHLFSLSGKVLYRSVNSSQREPIANYIQEMAFKQKVDNSNYLEIRLSSSLPNGQDLFLETGLELKWAN